MRGHFAVRYHIEGEDPVLLEFVQEEVYKRGYFDLVGRAIEGGKEVTVEVFDNVRGDSITFKVDGNVKLRFRFALPDQHGDLSAIILERIL